MRVFWSLNFANTDSNYHTSKLTDAVVTEFIFSEYKEKVSVTLEKNILRF